MSVSGGQWRSEGGAWGAGGQGAGCQGGGAAAPGRRPEGGAKILPKNFLKFIY